MSKLIRAAGAVLWRPGSSGEPEVLLVHRPRYDDWSLPKGKAEPGELPPRTAVREVTEETGVPPLLGARLPSADYQVKGRAKRVDYWLAVPAETGEAAGKPDGGEVDQTEWLPATRAWRRASYPHERELLAGLAGPSGPAPVPSVPLLLVRHATAVPKGTVPDLDRPLDGGGTADAKTLAGLLASFTRPRRVVSSPALRCTETVRRLAARAGVPVEPSPSLAPPVSRIITTSVPPPGQLAAALALAGEPAVLCLHRENLPDAVAGACAALGAEPPPDPALAKGGFWVLMVARDPGRRPRLLAADRYPPPGGAW